MTQRFRGREIAHRSLGVEKLDDIIESLSDISKVEVPPRQIGRQTSLLLAPDKAKIESLKAKLAREKKAADPKAALAEEETPDTDVLIDEVDDQDELDALADEIETDVDATDSSTAEESKAN